MDQKVPLDAGVMCAYIDRLCALFILARGYQTRKTVHSLVLPESWLLEVWKNFDKFKLKQSRSYGVLVLSVRKFLGHIFAADTKTGTFTDIYKAAGPSNSSAYVIRLDVHGRNPFLCKRYHHCATVSTTLCDILI